MSPRMARMGLMIAIAAMLVTAIVLVWTNASIYGDGSWYLVSLIHLGHPRPIDGREAVNYLKELPAWLGLKAGITNIHTLTLLQSLGFIMEPLIGWCAALWTARHSKWLFSLVLLSAGLGYATCMVFSVNELNLTLALLVLVLVALADEQPWRPLRAAAVFAAALVLVWAYEFMVAWGPLLFWYAVLRHRGWQRAGDRQMARYAAIVALLGAAAIFVAIYTLLFHTSPNTEGFGSGLIGRPYTSGTQAIAAGLLVVAAVLQSRHKRADGGASLSGALPGPGGDSRQDQGRAKILGWVAVLSVVAAMLLLVHSVLVWGRPGVTYTARAWPSVFVIAVQLVLLTCLLRPQIEVLFTRASDHLVGPALAFCVLSMISPILFGFGFHSFADNLRRTIDTHPGQMIRSEAAVPSAQQKYLWTWANESLSLLLRSSAHSGIVENDQTKGGWLPFPSAAVYRQIADRYDW